VTCDGLDASEMYGEGVILRLQPVENRKEFSNKRTADRCIGQREFYGYLDWSRIAFLVVGNGGRDGKQWFFGRVGTVNQLLCSGSSLVTFCHSR
jgi:hypothetical protein